MVTDGYFDIPAVKQFMICLLSVRLPILTGIKFSTGVENTVGKGEIAHNE